MSGRRVAPAGASSTSAKSTASPGRNLGSGTWRLSGLRLLRRRPPSRLSSVRIAVRVQPRAAKITRGYYNRSTLWRVPAARRLRREWIDFRRRLEQTRNIVSCSSRVPSPAMPDVAVIAQLRDTRSSASKATGIAAASVLPFGVERARRAAGRRGPAARCAPRNRRRHRRHPGDDASATLFLAGIAARAWGPVLWVVRRRDLFAPGLYQAGLAPHRVIYAEAADDAELLALMEEGLRHRGLGAVIGEAKRAATASTRRLQLAAEGGQDDRAADEAPCAREAPTRSRSPSAAVTRWRVASAPSAPLPARRHRPRALGPFLRPPARRRCIRHPRGGYR